MLTSKFLWSPNVEKPTQLDIFREHINTIYNLNLASYSDLHKWSIDEFPTFWEAWWMFGNFIGEGTPMSFVSKDARMTSIPRWFPHLKLNFTENLLRHNDNVVALYYTGEGAGVSSITYYQLNRMVAEYALALQATGVVVGDRVCGYLPNGLVAVVAMLATASIGAIWSSVSPDFGSSGVLDRFSQIDPKVIFSVEAVRYNGKIHDHLTKLKIVVDKLQTSKVIIAPFVKPQTDIDISSITNSVFLEDFLSGRPRGVPVEFVRFAFNHPLFIMFSSGTTGVPKCIVHSAGGTLVQVAKEHVLHCNIQRSDVMMYYTTTGWMMWNWLALGLFTGCSLVLFDGSPLVPTLTTLWDLVDDLGITILGTGAKWLSVMHEKGVHPQKTHSLHTLRAILSTGSHLSPESFVYVYSKIKKDVMLGSISGGTDIMSCFVGCNPILAVNEGQIQCKLLGMAVEAWNENGEAVQDERAELVCTKPFPSMPLHFWNDPNNEKYMKSYFNKYPHIWHHGDFCIFHSDSDGITILGRSDGTLNPSGVRFGSSEIYNIVDTFEEIEDSLCIGHTLKDEERVLLFLKMVNGTCVDEAFVKKIKCTIRANLSARHVPYIILPIEDIPYTMSGKKVEVAVKLILKGEEVLNESSLKNPECLEFYRQKVSLLQPVI